MLIWPIHCIIFIPKMGPLTMIFSNPVPPDFCTKNFIALQRIPQPKATIYLCVEDSVPFNKGPMMGFFSPFHKKVRWIVLMALRTHFGVAKTENKYRGMAWRMDLIRTRWPSRLRECRVQWDNRSSIFVRSSLHEEYLRPESIRGALRYFEGRVAILKLRTRAMFLWVGIGVLKKNISDFSWLSVIPEDLEKVVRMCLRALAS